MLVLQDAVADVARFGDGRGACGDASGSGGADGSAGGVAVGVDGVVDAGAADAGTHDESAASDADVDVSGYGGAVFVLAESSSSPSCGPLSSCCHLTCQMDDETMLPSIAFWLLNASEGLEVKHRRCSCWAPASP